MVFVLLARDEAAPVAIRAWVEERIRLRQESGRGRANQRGIAMCPHDGIATQGEPMSAEPALPVSQPAEELHHEGKCTAMYSSYACTCGLEWREKLAERDRELQQAAADRKVWLDAVNLELTQLREWANREEKRAEKAEGELQQARERLAETMSDFGRVAGEDQEAINAVRTQLSEAREELARLKAKT